MGLIKLAEMLQSTPTVGLIHLFSFGSLTSSFFLFQLLFSSTFTSLVRCHLLLKMHLQYPAHHFLSFHHAKRVSKTSLFHFSSQPICFQVALGKHFLRDRLQRCLLISSAMIIKSCFCRSLRDYQSLKRKFSSFSCSNIYSPPFHLKLSFTSRWWHPGQLHFPKHLLSECQEGLLIQGRNSSWLSKGRVTQMIITVHHSS